MKRARKQPDPTEAERVIEDIRAVRQQIWRRGGGTVEGFLREAFGEARPTSGNRTSPAAKSVGPRPSRRKSH